MLGGGPTTTTVVELVVTNVKNSAVTVASKGEGRNGGGGSGSGSCSTGSSGSVNKNKQRKDFHQSDKDIMVMTSMSENFQNFQQDEILIHGGKSDSFNRKTSL